ncbi:MAG: energy transducer TonB [Kofleriaceae bacterium]
MRNVVVLWTVRVLWILGLLGGTANADAVPGVTPDEQALLDAVVSQDVAAFARLAPRPFALRSVWFRDPDCARQFSGVVEVSAERDASLLHCLATLGLRAQPVPGNRPHLVYDPGVRLNVDMYSGGLLVIESEWLGDPTAAPVTQEELARHVIGGSPSFEPPPAVREAIEQAPNKKAIVELMTCVGKTGKLESTRITRRRSPDEYVRAVEAAARARSFTPFVTHGKPVRACAREVVSVPAGVGAKELWFFPGVAQPAQVAVAADDATVQAWLDALAKRDTAAFARLLAPNAVISSLWFDSARCATQFSGRFMASEANRDALLACLSDLGVHAAPQGLRPESPSRLENQLSVVYEPGVAMDLRVRDGAIVQIDTHLRYSADPDAAPVAADALEAHRIAGSVTIEPEPALRDAVPGSEYRVAFVQLVACVDRAGKLESTRIVQTSGHDDYARAVIAATAKWKFKPFLRRGKAIRACAVELIAYPPDQRAHVFSTPPPPPPPPPSPPHNVPPKALEAHRLSGEQNIVPDDETKADILKSHNDKVIGSYKLCIDTAGKVTTAAQLKSTGFAAYDTKLKEQLRTWTYRPFLIDGQPKPVCTAVTFIYSQD